MRGKTVGALPSAVSPEARRRLLSIDKRRGVLLVLATVALLAAAAGCDEDAGRWGNPQVAAEAQDVWRFDAVPDLVLDIETANGAVTILGSDATTEVGVRATRSARGRTEEEAQDRLARIDYSAQALEGRVVLRYHATGQEEDVRRFAGVAFDVTLPRGARILVRTSNGAVSVEAIRGNATVTTANGAVDLYDIEGSVIAETSNGRVEAVRVAGDVHARTSNGDLWMEEIIGVVDGETSNGSVRYVGAPSGEANRLWTSNGSITVRVPATASVRFRATTSQGSLRSQLPLVGDTDGDDWNAELNPPATATISLRTSNGSIRIDGGL